MSEGVNLFFLHACMLPNDSASGNYYAKFIILKRSLNNQVRELFLIKQFNNYLWKWGICKMDIFFIYAQPKPDGPH